MSNWFAGISQAASGLNAARYGLDVTAQNMANADTDGYVRQSSHQVSVAMGDVPALYTRNGDLGGVAVDATNRQTDPVLDNRMRNEHARAALADTTSTQLSNVESVLGEPSDDGLSSQLSTFWADWGTVSNHAGSTPARTVLLQDASSVAGTLNTMSAALQDVTSSTNDSLTADVASVNSAASNLATLNGKIAVASAVGENANSLLDQRDQLLDSLSKLAGATSTIGANGAATVTVGGQTLVSGVNAATMTSDAGANLAVGGTGVTVGSGSIGAEATALTTTLPGYQSRLDIVATTLRDTVNNVQATGYDQNGAAGTAMFTGTGAGDLSVVLTDPAGVAAAGGPGASNDGSHALAASQLGAAPGSPDSAFTGLVGQVGTASALATQQASTQDGVSANVDALKASVSGVSLDEEASAMLTYQQAFNASSRVLTAMDSMLDTLINHTGLVGLQ